uniref:Uncharacterized protein n=1 Tax=Anopheles farauti TaxID=69004 RepID=A0A182QAL8_9DIPT
MRSNRSGGYGSYMIVSEMLPELLFTVGGGMQDFAKDDLGLLSTSVVSSDKDPLGQTHPPQAHDHHGVLHQAHLHPAVSGNTVVLGVDDIKLTHLPDQEETDRDLYPWHSGSNIGSRFLRSSDDPLISGGTNDNPHDNELSVPTVSQSMCPSPTTTPPSSKHHHHRHPGVILTPELPDATLSPLRTPPKVAPSTPHQKEPAAKRTANGAPRARRKGPLKLRFHHQALPQEYLDHYEATQNNLQRKVEQVSSKQSRTQQQSKSSSGASSAHQQQQQQQQSSRKAIMERQAALEREERTNESVRSWLQKILELQKEGVSMAPLKDEVVAPSQTSPTSVASAESSSGSSGHQSAPQQKRIVSYTDLPYMGEITLDNSKPRRGRKPKKADICHLIYKNYGTILPGTPSREFGLEKGAVGQAKGCSKSVASLLERRLTSCDERKAQPAGDRKLPVAADQHQSVHKGRRKDVEPLNLCVRDSGGSVLPVVGGAETFSVSSSEDDPDEVFASSCPTPIITPSDLCTDQALAANMKLSLPTLQSSSGNSTVETPSTAETPPGYMYWSSNTNGMFVHPLPVYNSPPVQAGEVGLGRLPEDTMARNSPSCTVSPPISPDGFPLGASQQQHPLIIPKHISQLMKHGKQSPPTVGQRSPPAAQKRKRSAIFIPPVPAENSPNPATEVSICKFKFTGGAKPCLQEKKILSVDSGGNFRYYSGTGDKSMRGYEFFPRESLQQSSINATSTTGAFLNASGERIACDLPPPSLGLSNDLLQIPEFPTSPQPSGGDPSSPGVPASQQHRLNPANSASERRRRKTRRATQRESLEKTFKEKGFLIQTQQLQSAEDYLPGELQQHQHQQHQLQEGDMSNVIMPAQEDTAGDEGSQLASSAGNVRMDVGERLESAPEEATPQSTVLDRTRRNRRISSTSVTSQHVHSETLVIDTAYHRHGCSSPVVE